MVALNYSGDDEDDDAAKAELERVEHAAKADGSLSFLVVRDWGRKRLYNQSQMGSIGEKIEVDFIISTGDNFYDDGLRGVKDPAFHQSFSDIYTAPSLQKQWYIVLGNHDYRGNVEAQLSPMLRKMDTRWLCLRSFILIAGPQMVEIFFVDATPFVSNYFIDPKDHVYDWKGISPRLHYINNLLLEFESGLRESTAKWKIVVGQHTIKSAGHHGNTHELAIHLLPILQAYHVDLYISNTDSSIQFLTSGGGSKAWRGDVNNRWNPQKMKFYYDGQGFMSVEMTETDVDIKFYDVFGYAIYKWSTSKLISSAM
ncbi:purple acid phosphatase 3-like [Gossypium arboreum]|uniref:purple acid phosphatase 3-like n=1 Tax=Gossypium arboreum TaxID=29729 RepID=UPI0022F198EF|nr:purple acid phosphatase 3-like [Gossypium arboreum]